jgi:uncharacterized protein YecT (DUF1311 family)
LDYCGSDGTDLTGGDTNAAPRRAVSAPLGAARDAGGEHMKYLALLVSIAAMTWPAFAQDSKEYAVCSNAAKTQAEMNSCAGAEAARADKELNDVYAQVLAKAASVPEAAAKVKSAERCWIAFRDAYIEATYPAKDKHMEYGSMYVLNVGLLRAKLTRQQVAALHELLNHYGKVDQ